MMRRLLGLGCAVVAVVLVVALPSLGEAAAPATGAQASAATGGTSSAPAGPAPKIRIDEKVYDFGDVWEGTKVEHDFVVNNDGQALLEIPSVRAGCGCTATQSDKAIEPGKTGKIHVAFNTTGKGATPKTVVYVQTNDPANSRIELRMEGRAKTRIEITPRGGVFFGKVIENKVNPVTVTLKSNLDKPFKPVLQPLAANKDLFKVALKELKPEKEYEVTVSAVPPFPEGSASSTLEIKTGLDEMPVISLPLSIYVPPAIEVNPTLIALGAPPARELPRPIDISLNASGQMKLISANCTDPKVKTSILEMVPGRRFRVLCQIPAGYNILNNEKVEVKIETDYAPKKEIIIPLTMKFPPPQPAQIQGKPAAAAPIPDKPSLDMSVLSLDVGQLKPDQAVSQEIYFRNGGGKQLDISQVTGSTGVTIDPGFTKNIAPGAAGMITARLTAPKKPGPFTEKVTIVSNDPVRPNIPVSLTGVTRAYVELRPPAGVDFGRRPQDYSRPRFVEMAYNGPGKIKYLKAECNSPKFTVHLDVYGDTGKARVEINAKPPFDKGATTAEIQVTTDNELQPVLKIPVTLVMPSRVVVEPTQLTFLKGDTHIQKKVVTITDNGDKPLHILAIERSSDKLQTQFFPDQDGLSYMLYVTVPVLFHTPTGEEKIVIRTDDPEFKELVIPISFKTFQDMSPK